MRKQAYSLDTLIRSATLLLAAGLALASRLPAQTVKIDPPPAPVAGESWLKHLQRSFDETSMGKTGQLGPPTAVPAVEFARWQQGLSPESGNANVTLHGSDLYRMNCRGCHGADGQGAPPEINSVINPVRATSAAAVMERMKTAGMDINRADAVKMARQAQGMLLNRLHHGGQDMPAFPHLREAEVQSLVAYLRQLAGVRDAERGSVVVRESRVRVGEQIVKSTCHVCHGAAGPNPSPQQLYEGAIPPLNTLAVRTNRAEFIRKVTHGAPVRMGSPSELFRGRMPVFYYLTEDEAAEVYLYLTRYPPYQWAVLDPMPSSASAGDNQSGSDSGPQLTGAFFSAGVERGVAPAKAADLKLADVPLVAGFIVIAILGLGFGFTVCELKRLCTSRERKKGPGGMTAAAEEDCLSRLPERADSELVA